MKYVVGRIGQALLAVWAAYTITFVILFVLPSDPVAVMLNSSGDGTYVDPAQVEALTQQYGFDQPPIVQYFTRMLGILTGDFGSSVHYGRPVLTLILEALPSTLLLTACGLVLALVSGVLVAVAATATKAAWLASLLRSLPPFAASLPVFWVGLMLLQVFSFQLGWFPAVGDRGFVSLVLPAITLALPSSASIAQVLIRGLEDVDREPFIDVLRATGASRTSIVIRHGLRNALLPVLTILGLTAGGLLSGAVVTETVFSRAGLGRLTQGAVTAQDIPLVQGIVVLAAVGFVLINLIVDLVYPLLDPRMRRRGASA